MCMHVMSSAVTIGSNYVRYDAKTSPDQYIYLLALNLELVILY